MATDHADGEATDWLASSSPVERLRAAAIAGDPAPAAAHLASLARCTDRDAVRAALDRLALPEVAGAWFGLCRAALAAAPDKDGPAGDELRLLIGRRLVRAKFLLDGAARDADWIGELLGAVSIRRLLRWTRGPADQIRLLIFLSAFTPTRERAAAFARAAGILVDQGDDYVARLRRLHRRGVLDGVALARCAAVFDPADAVTAALAAYLATVPGIDVLLWPSVAEHALSPALSILILAERDEPWRAERLALAGGADVRAVHAALARYRRIPSLALARDCVRFQRGGAAEAAVVLGRDLVALGFRREAVDLLEPAAAVSAEAAALWAGAKSRMLPDAPAAAPWEAARAAHDTPAIHNGLAAALVQDLRYEEAEALLRARIAAPEAGTADWTALVRFQERIGDNAGWSRSLEAGAQAFGEEHGWSVAERARFAFASGLPVTTGDILPEASDQDRIGLWRVVAEHMPAEQRADGAVALWRRIAARSGRMSDEYELILALLRTGAFDEARTRLEIATRVKPGAYLLHVKLAQLFERLGDYSRALGSFADAHAVHPANVHAVCGIARCLVYLDRHDALAGWLDGFDGCDIGFSWTHAMRALAAARRGERVAAAESVTALRALVRSFLDASAAARAKEPTAVWQHGAFTSHPDPRSATFGRRFDAELARICAAERVAIVGNGPSLIGGRHGPDIDAHDHVLRINDFRLGGFEADVGRRTSLWYSGANRLASPDRDAVEGVPTLLCQPEWYHFPDLPAFSRSRLGIALGDEAAFLPPDIYWLLSTRLLYPRPTSGLRAIALVDLFADRDYRLFGFDFFEDGNAHYFERPMALHVDPLHALEFERDFARLVLPLGGRMRGIG